MRDETSSRFSRRPVERLSITSTEPSPKASRPRTKADPIKPAPPVTTYFFIIASISFRQLRIPTVIVLWAGGWGRARGYILVNYSYPVVAPRTCPSGFARPDDGLLWQLWQGTVGEVDDIL